MNAGKRYLINRLVQKSHNGSAVTITLLTTFMKLHFVMTTMSVSSNDWHPNLLEKLTIAAYNKRERRESVIYYYNDLFVGFILTKGMCILKNLYCVERKLC